MAKYDDLDRDSLIRLLQRRDAERQLGLVWERDDIEADAAVNADYVALTLDPAHSHGDAPWDNLIIEGDNFDALRALRMSHKGAIRCIYIDPPYNTGNRDFIYNDRFVDKTHRFRHSLWLEFMYQRLTLAKELLADDGMIFVSIDDNELFRLGMLMDRVFGEGAHLATFVWETDGTFDNQAAIKTSHEYILCYAKDADNVTHPSVVDPNTEEDSKLFRPEIRNSIIKNGPKNPVSSITLPAGFPANFEAGVIPAREDAWPHIDRDIVVENWRTTNEVIVQSGWASKALAESFITNHFTKVIDRKSQRTRFELTVNGAIEGVKDRENASYVLTVLRNMGNVRAESGALAEMGISFSYPKPDLLIRYFLSIASDRNGIFVDFFAGSGTTAHAVAKLNAEDQGTRKFILVSSTEATEDQPDKNLCRDVCAQRVRRVLGGYTNDKGEAVEGLGGGFAYLRARRIPKHRLSLKLDHPEIWNALQLLHGHPLTPWAGGGFAVDERDGGAVAYVADAYPATRARLEEWLTQRGTQAATVYSWAPERYRTADSPHDWRPIPQHLRERFGR